MAATSLADLLKLVTEGAGKPVPDDAYCADEAAAASKYSAVHMGRMLRDKANSGELVRVWGRRGNTRHRWYYRPATKGAR